MTPKVGIILINYKDYAQQFLTDCRDSLRQTDYPKDKFFVYIVDNATTEETQNYLRKEYPEAIIIPNEENSGWGGGNNKGIERAFQDGCDDIVFLNMDVIVEKNWLKELVKAAYADSRIGITQAKLLLHPIPPDGQPMINSLGNEIHFLGFGFCRGYGMKESQLKSSFDFQPSFYGSRLAEIPYASGAAMYVRGDVFRKIGLCDEELFMYSDDSEFCLRAKLMGYRVVLSPSSIVWHKYQFSRSIRQIYFMERNRLINLLYFYKWPTLFLILPAFLIFEFGLLFYALKNNWLQAKIQSWGYFLKRENLKRILKKRREIQTSRLLSDRELLKDFTGKILFQEVSNFMLNFLANPLMNVYWQIVKKIIFW
jgi:GT2 family glycosyltransferase